MADNGRIRAMYETWHEAWGRGQIEAYDTSVLAGYVGQLLDDAAAAEARIAELTAVVRSMVDDAIQTHYSGNVACVWCGNAASDSDTQINIHIHDEYCPVWQGINAIAPAAEQQEGGEG